MNRFLNSWKANNSINLMLLDSIGDEMFYRLSKAGRMATPVEHFIHLYHTRLLWLQEHDPQLSCGLEKLRHRGLHKRELHEALSKTGDAMQELIRKTITDGKVKHFRSPQEFLIFVFSQEAQCRNNILMASLQNLN